MMTYWTIAASRTAARLLCCTALSTCVMVAAPAVAQARSAISISAQPASEAIKQLAKQTGTQILFDYDKLRGVRSHAVEGAASPLAALQAMLRGTGFEVGETPSGALMVRPSREAPGSPLRMPRLVAKARRPQTPQRLSLRARGSRARLIIRPARSRSPRKRTSSVRGRAICTKS